MLKPDDPIKLFSRQVSKLVHADKKFEAAKAVNEFARLGVRLDDDNPDKYLPILQHWLHYLLNSGAPEEAAGLLWTPNKVTTEPQCTKDLWSLFESTSMGLVMGAASMSKSYGLGGVRFFLEWIRDPANTAIKIVGPSEDHLESNLFSHLVDLHKCASLPMPGKIGELFIGLDRRNQFSSIKGLVIPKGDKKKAGRLQGGKRRPRSKAHSIFGRLTRMFIFIDEFENVPGGIWSDIDNILSNIQEEGEFEGFKIFGAWNPQDTTNEVYRRAEPPMGWDSFNIETDYRWKSKMGWDVLRLDGEKSENVIQEKVIYPGLQTKAGLDTIAKQGGKQSAGYYSMGRGAYPPAGIDMIIIPSALWARMIGEFIWYEDPQPVSSLDMALLGGDAAVYTLGKWGKATGIKFPPSISHPQGHKMMFKDRSGNIIVRWGLQADQQLPLPKGDTVQMKERSIELNRKAGVRGEFFAIDRTGVGAGTADLIKHEWSSLIHDVNYSQACSADKIMLEDTKLCNEQFPRMDSELWFAMRSWGEFQYFLVSPSLDRTKLTSQITQRKFKTSGGKSRVESKEDYQNRQTNKESPNEADSLTLFVHAARKGSSVGPLSMKMDEMIDLPGEDDGWDNSISYPGGVRIDESNRTDFLPDEDSDRISIL